MRNKDGMNPLEIAQGMKGLSEGKERSIKFMCEEMMKRTKKKKKAKTGKKKTSLDLYTESLCFHTHPILQQSLNLSQQVFHICYVRNLLL